MDKPINQFLEGSLPSGHFEAVEKNPEHVQTLLLAAELHSMSASKIGETDPVGAFQLFYDAARKTLQAYLATGGFRITALGGHYAYVRFAESGVFEDSVFLNFREMRILRNMVEYPESGSAGLRIQDLKAAEETCFEMLRIVSALLTKNPPPK